MVTCILSGHFDHTVRLTKVALLEPFYNRREIRKIFLVSFLRFNTIVHKAKGTELQKVLIGVAAFPGVVASNPNVTAGNLLDVCNRGGGLLGVMGEILRYTVHGDEIDGISDSDDDDHSDDDHSDDDDDSNNSNDSDDNNDDY